MKTVTRTYRPSKLVGQLYARLWGSSKAHMPVGNVTKLVLKHKEDVDKLDNMMSIGGGIYAEDRRVTDVTMEIELSDFNLTNLCRAVLGTSSVVPAGNMVDEPFVATLGGLLRLQHIQPKNLALKMGDDKTTATTVNALSNFEVRPEGVFLFPEAQSITEDAKLWASYEYGEYANIEALTAKPPELDFLFGGLNSVDNGQPQRIHVFRVSQSVTKELALINKNIDSITVDGSVLMDPTRTGAGISPYYNTSFV